MMHMTFYWGTKVTILFDAWTTNSYTSYAFSLLACFLIAVFYQFIEGWRIKLKLLASSPPQSSLEAPLIHSKLVGAGKSSSKIIGSIVFGINSAIGYMLMLAIMSFNGGVFVAVVVGIASGYFVFRSGDEDDQVVVDNPCACA
ncbi:copper transporter 5.1-like [Apium graveolens]|uniref:copper transporter 5.1-like n=1 Tax=Apium graveolens TaxID=4045 RepID=UPI003D7B37B0